MLPLVSVCVPTFNSEKYLRQTLDCVLGQTFQDIEIVVVDNRSTDCTVGICREYQQQDRRLSIHENQTNLGAFANFNRCIQLATGTYIKFLMSDDLLEPT